MELERENKRLKVLIVILLVFLVAFGGYLAYILYFNKIDDNNSISTNDNEVVNDNNTESLENDDILVNNDFDFNSKCNAEYSSCILDEIDFSTSGQSVNEGNFLHRYTANLYVDGTVDVDYSISTNMYTPESTSEQYKGQLSNINDAIQIINFSTPDDLPGQLIYILLSNGDVYFYRLGDVMKKEFEATKVDSVQNVKKLFVYHHPKNAWEMMAITSDNKTISLKMESV